MGTSDQLVVDAPRLAQMGREEDIVTMLKDFSNHHYEEGKAEGLD